MKNVTTWTLLLLVFIVHQSSPAAIIHVPADQPTIQAGIDAAADGDTVLVADGVYTGEGNWHIVLGGKAITVQSENGADHCTIDLGNQGAGIHFLDGEGPGTVLEGFDIRNAGQDPGGAVHIRAAAPVVRDNAFELNNGTTHSAIAVLKGSDPLIEGNTFNVCEPATILVEQSSATIRYNSFTHGDDAFIRCSTLDDPMVVTIEGNYFSDCDGAGIEADDASVVIESNYILLCDDGAIIVHRGAALIENNQLRLNYGGGITAVESPATIRRNLIHENHGEQCGGIRCEAGDARILDNTLDDNIAYEHGGGIVCLGECSPTIVNNLIINNRANIDGGGVACFDNASPLLVNNTLAGNEAWNAGGAIACWNGSTVEVSDAVLWGNIAPTAPEIVIGSAGGPAALSIAWSDLDDGKSAVVIESGSELLWGKGMIDADPLFTSGPLAEHYLSQTAAGQAVDSPCVDAGNPANGEHRGTTRTDWVEDEGIVDMGYHTPENRSSTLIVAGPGPGPDNPPRVRTIPPMHGAPYSSEFDAYAATGYGVNITVGRLAGTCSDSVITGAGPGAVYGPHVRGFDENGDPRSGLDFLAYGTNKYGVNVAAGDLDGDGIDEIITGAGPGAVFGSHVRAFAFDGTAVTVCPGVSYFAYGTPKWGVNVSAGDIDGDGYDEIVTGPGPGAVYGPHVRGWNVDGSQAVAPVSAVSYFAYGTLKYGVNVTCGDVDGDGIDEIVTGAGPGDLFGPHVRGWNYDGDTLAALPDFSYFAWLTGSQRHGVNVYAGADVNSDGRNDVIAGRGPAPDANGQVKVFSYVDGEVVEWIAIDAFEGMTHGTTVAAGTFYIRTKNGDPNGI